MSGEFAVKLTDRAQLDLLDIWLAIGVHSTKNADRYLDVLHSRINSLAMYPDRGAPRPLLGKGIRVLIEGNYLIVYRVIAGEVLVIRVVHGARDLESLIV